jgi:hypothetical protein
VDELNLGPCCCCGRATVRARNIVMMSRRAPVPGTGWGCMMCGLPPDGAVYVACDDCAEGDVPPVEVCRGYAATKVRVPVDQLDEGVFEHDLSKHAEG